MIHFGYELRRVADNSLLAEGETTHIVADAQMRKTVLPEKYMRIHLPKAIVSCGIEE